MRLALTLPISRAETPTTWLSRLAQLNGSLHANDFLKDLGLNWRRLIGGNLEQIPRLAELTGCDSRELLQHAVRKGPGKTRMIGSEPILSRLLSFEVLKVCPTCVRETISTEGYMLHGLPVYWQLAPIRTCEIHGQALVTLPPPDASRCKFDVAGRILDHLPMLYARPNANEREASEYEMYLIGRIDCDRRSAPTWLDGLDLNAIAKTCEHLGKIAFDECNPSGANRAELIDAKLRNEAQLFSAIKGSPCSLKRILHEIRQRPKTRGEGFRREFGRFAIWIETQHDRPGVTPLLDNVRDFVEEAFPMAAGQVVLGRKCKERKLHSVMSVSHQYGISHIRVRRLFKTIRQKNGLHGLSPPDGNNCVPAKFYDPWLARYARSWNEKQAGSVLGMRWYRLDELVEADLLNVFVDLPGMGRRFESLAVLQLIERVFEGSVCVRKPSNGQFPISQIPNRCACTTVDVVQAVLERKLPFVGCDPTKPGLSALVADKQEVLDALEGPTLEGLTQAEAFKRWRINTSTMACLVREGILGIEHTKHPRNRRPMKIIPPAEVERFETDFLTLGCIASKIGKHPVRVLHELRKQKIEPIDLPAGISCLYMRQEAERYITAHD